jgi:hypothetical protein
MNMSVSNWRWMMGFFAYPRKNHHSKNDLATELLTTLVSPSVFTEFLTMSGYLLLTG